MRDRHALLLEMHLSTTEKVVDWNCNFFRNVNQERLLHASQCLVYSLVTDLQNLWASIILLSQLINLKANNLINGAASIA